IPYAARVENSASRFVIVIITPHCGVVLLDPFPAERFCIFSDPFFELRVSRIVLPDVIPHCSFFESERGKRHCIKAFADSGITWGKFTLLLKRDLLPETRQIHNAKR